MDTSAYALIHEARNIVAEKNNTILPERMRDTAAQIAEHLTHYEELVAKYSQHTKATTTEISNAIRANRVLESLVSTYTLARTLYLENKVLKQELERAEQESRTDALTKLPNIKAAIEYYDELVGKILSGKLRTASLISLDLKKFKDINDTYGQGAGDIVLKNTARLLESEVRSSEELNEEGDIACNDRVFRIGGDEFMIILQGSQEQSEKMASRLKTRFSLALKEGARTTLAPKYCDLRAEVIPLDTSISGDKMTQLLRGKKFETPRNPTLMDYKD